MPSSNRFLTDQWYVETAPLAGPAIAAVKTGQIKFIPENWEKTYFDWMNRIEDWSHQPARASHPGLIMTKVRFTLGAMRRKSAKNTGSAQQSASLKTPTSLDTWFSSALWPFSTLGWPENTEALKTFYPTSVLVTGFDIIFFWVARMIMMGLSSWVTYPSTRSTFTAWCAITKARKCPSPG